MKKPTKIENFNKALNQAAAEFKSTADPVLQNLIKIFPIPMGDWKLTVNFSNFSACTKKGYWGGRPFFADSGDKFNLSSKDVDYHFLNESEIPLPFYFYYTEFLTLVIPDGDHHTIEEEEAGFLFKKESEFIYQDYYNHLAPISTTTTIEQFIESEGGSQIVSDAILGHVEDEDLEK